MTEERLAPVQALYEAYIAQVEELERNRKFGQGLFGLPGGPKDDSCHGRFASELEELLGQLRAQGLTSAQLRELLTYMYTIPEAHREPRSSYWMLIAVQGLTLELMDGLDREDAAALGALFNRTYPRRDRLPHQKKICAALMR